MNHLIAPSMLSADFGNLLADIEMVNKSMADWFHLDVMDGHFVSNISFGIPVVKGINRYATKPLDVHIMLSYPIKYIDAFRDAGADRISIHFEIENGLEDTLEKIKATGLATGLVLNPDTEISNISHLISDLDQIIVMSVYPGHGGQKFIPGSLEKVAELKNLVRSINSKCLIEVDGGVNLDNAADIVSAGADILVAGNTVFSSEDPSFTIQMLKKHSCKHYWRLNIV